MVRQPSGTGRPGGWKRVTRDSRGPRDEHERHHPAPHRRRAADLGQRARQRGRDHLGSTVPCSRITSSTGLPKIRPRAAASADGLDLQRHARSSTVTSKPASVGSRRSSGASSSSVGHRVELGRVLREEAPDHLVRDGADRTVLERAPDVEHERAARREDTAGLPERPRLVGHEHDPERGRPPRSKDASANGRSWASAVRHSTASPPTASRAYSSMGPLRSVAASATSGPRCARNRRVTIPVPHAISSTARARDLEPPDQVRGEGLEQQRPEMSIVVLRECSRRTECAWRS